jgi:hypothetical protein
VTALINDAESRIEEFQEALRTDEVRREEEIRQEKEAVANAKRQAEAEAAARVREIEDKRAMWDTLGKELGLDGDIVIHTKVHPSYPLNDNIVSLVLPARRLARRAKALKARPAYPVRVSMGFAHTAVSGLLPTSCRLSI